MTGMAQSLFVLGTSSHAGKSVLTAGLCRLLRRRGISVAPFKAQNMALNSFVTASGGEMGRAQVVQAEACGIQPEVEMNPILLKPSGENCVQVILRGQVFANMSAQEYYQQKSLFFEEVLTCHSELAKRFEIIVIEGAGSPVEMNLLDRDIVNLPLARKINASCLLVADIDRGGVFASIVGTHELCDPEDRHRIRAFVINKFRGQESLFTPGIEFLERRTGWPCMGVLPYLDWLKLEEEDSVALDSKAVKKDSPKTLNVAVIQFPHLSNYTDFDPLEQSNVSLSYVTTPEDLGRPDLTILPGTKNTLEDLLWLRSNGFEEPIQILAKSGAAVLGICGGFQMLGLRLLDPHKVESNRREVNGLGLLQVETTLTARKTTCQVRAVHLDSGEPVDGYEIHMGQTKAQETYPPLFRVLQRGEVATEEYEGVLHGNVAGTYLHGIFENSGFTQNFLASLARKSGKNFRFRSGFNKDQLHERWADFLEEKLKLELLSEIIGRPLESL